MVLLRPVFCATLTTSYATTCRWTQAKQILVLLCQCTMSACLGLGSWLGTCHPVLGLPPSGFVAGSAVEVLKRVGVITSPTNVELKSSSVLRTWFTVFIGTLLDTVEKCPILLHLVYRVSAAGQFLLPRDVGGCNAQFLPLVWKGLLLESRWFLCSVSWSVIESGQLPRGVTLSISTGFDSCNSRFVASFKDRTFTTFSSEWGAPSL